MTEGARIGACPSCGWRGMPERLWCPRCGENGVLETRVFEGRVRETTIVRRAVGGIAGPVRLGVVVGDGGGDIVVRLESGAGSGSRVRLYDDDGVAVARPR